MFLCEFFIDDTVFIFNVNGHKLFINCYFFSSLYKNLLVSTFTQFVFFFFYPHNFLMLYNGVIIILNNLSSRLLVFSCLYSATQHSS